VLRSKEQLVALKPLDDVMGLFTLRFADELVPPDKVDFEEPKKAPGDREVTMAAKLVEALAGDFKPEKYTDTYGHAVMELIERKAGGETIEPPKREKAEETDDLMAALEASLSGAGKS
jgi:DNA end-binding protein Ku